jgi:DNA repair exonuclease SbcCD ATPase subunit
MNNPHEIHFEKIRVQNFLSVKEAEFDFTKHNGMNYIFGHNMDVGKGDEMRNGAGKSALFGDALLFALFGKTGKNLKKASIVNRIVGKKCEGEVWFTAKGKRYHVINGASPAFCKIECWDGEEWSPITKSTMAETQAYLCDEILRSSYLMFKKMNVLSIGDNESIYEMSKATKRDFIENVFNLNVFGEMFKMVRIDYNKIDKLILQEQAKFTQLEKDVAIYADKIKNFETDKANRISSLNTQITTLHKSTGTLLAEDVDVDGKINKLKVAKDALAKQYRTLRDAKNKLEHKIVQSESEKNFKKADIDKYANIYDMVCDCCQTKLDECLGFSDNKKALDGLYGVIKASQTKKTTITNGIKTLLEKDDKIADTITLLERKRSDNERVKRVIESNKAKLELLEKSLEDEKSKTSSFDDLYEKYNEEKDELYKELSKKLDRRKYLNLLKSVLSEDGVKKHIIATLINALNNRIASYLEEMGSEYTVIFDPNFDCVFLTTTGECEYNNFSAGEKMRINHATMFAFQDIISTQGNLKTNILYCDELIDVSVDTVAIGAFLDILRRKTQEGQTVYLISHREAVAEDVFDNIIEVKKESGFTHIVSDPQGNVK